MARSYNTIVEFLKAKVNARSKKIKTHRGSLVSDVVIEGPAQEFAKLYTQSEQVSKNQSIETADPDGLKNLGFNDNKRKKAGTPANALVIFFSNSAPSTDITIPAGQIVSTKVGVSTAEIKFRTLRTVKMYASLASTYLNSDTNKYEISVEAEALVAGTTGNVGAFNINTIVNAVVGINGCYNPDASAGGTDEEENDAFRRRIALARRGNSIGTTDGILNIIYDNDYVEDAVMIGNRTSTRQEIGAIDVYIKGIKTTQFIDTFAAADFSNEFIFTKNPITYQDPSIVAFSNDAVAIPSHTIEKDLTSSYAGSVLASDKLTWDSPLPAEAGNVYLIYTYNSLVEELQNLFLSTDKDVQNTDLLIHWANEITIDLTISIRILDGFDSAVVKAAIRDNLANFFSSTKIGEEIQQSDVAGIIVNTEGVDDVLLPFSLFRSTDSTVLQNDRGNLQIPSDSYAASGTLTINTVVI